MTFGNMPTQDGPTRSDVVAIAAHVREVKLSHGIT